MIHRPWRRNLGGLLAVCGAWMTTSCASSFGMPRGGSTQGQETFDLWQVFVWAGIAVAAIVYALLVWSLIRYRRRRADAEEALGRQFHANIPLEIVYTAIPIVMVIGLFFLSLRAGERIGEVAPEPDVTLRVEAYSWGWRFSFPDEGAALVSQPSGEGVPGPVLMLPRGETVRIELTSNDVIHAFWVPGFLFKRDAIPGRINVFDMTPSVLGSFHGVCSEFCGLNHAFMTFTVTVVEPDEFDAWLAGLHGAPADPTGDVL